MSGGEPAALAAADLGASSGRVIFGRVGPGHLELAEIRRFRNGPVTLPDGLYWDVLGLYQDILGGLRDANRQAGGRLRGLAIDAWAVDYGVVNVHGALIATRGITAMTAPSLSSAQSTTPSHRSASTPSPAPNIYRSTPCTNSPLNPT